LREYKGWENYETVLTYGLLERANEPPRLVPLAIFAQARRKKRIYWCRGHFTDYQVFTVKARLIANDY
jgi:hypothetical protein